MKQNEQKHNIKCIVQHTMSKLVNDKHQIKSYHIFDIL